MYFIIFLLDLKSAKELSEQFIYNMHLRIQNFTTFNHKIELNENYIEYNS